jgi:hypothetical protein
MSKLIKMQAVVILILSSAILTYAGNIYHQRALEFRGGMTLYSAMQDPIDWAKQISPVLSEEMENAPDFGFSVLYRSHQNFVWNIGFNHLFSSRVAYVIDAVEYEEVVSANEFFLAPSFIFFPTRRVNFSLGAGPTLLMASLDRTTPQTVTGNMANFYGASGRNMGVLVLANMEFVITQSLALKVGGGFRNVLINDIDFLKTISGTDYNYTVVWTDASGTESDRRYELDFTGLFVEFGLRWYFVPKKLW